MTEVQPVHVRAEHDYHVHIGVSLNDIVQDSSWLRHGRVVLIVSNDDSAAWAKVVANIASAAGCQVTTVEVPRGEQAKSYETVMSLWDSCAQAGLDRGGLVVAVGGGTVTDVAGFAAATWLRGVDWVAVPTTTAGMVDAAIGGKTGINAAGGKNLVGSFHSPIGVYCALETLRTLPTAEFAAGLAEAVKCGFAGAPHILDVVADQGSGLLDADHPALPQVIRAAAQFKADVVALDFTESAASTSTTDSLGRELLNYGHTFGHALEAASGYTVRHGDAVSVGMVFAAELAEAVGAAGPGLAATHRVALTSLGLPTAHAHEDFTSLLALMGRDKKARSGVLKFVLLGSIGNPTGLSGPDQTALERAFERTRSAGTGIVLGAAGTSPTSAP